MTTKYLKDSVIIDLLRKAGFSDDKAKLAFCVIQGESAGDPYSTNYNGEGKDGRPPRPPKNWFPGGESHDIGIVQWSDYWQLADEDSVVYNPDKDLAYRDAYNPVWSINKLYEYTEAGAKNWSTWNAYTNGSYADFMPRAERALLLPAPAPFWKVTVGGRTPVPASSIPARCNPPISTKRFFDQNKALEPGDVVKPGTVVLVTNTTTKIQAGPVHPAF